MCASGSEWEALVKLLPAGTEARFTEEFNCIMARWPTGVQRKRNECLEQIRLCDQAMAIIPQLPPINADLYRLMDCRAKCQARVDIMERELRQYKTRRYIDALLLAKHIGVPLGYTSNNASGPGVDYVLAVARVLGTPVSAATALQIVRVYYKRQPAESSMRAKGGMVTDSFVVDDPGRIRGDS